jgi:arylsulfatase A-like enzyme
MSKPFKGTINIDIEDSTPDWAPYAQPVPPDGAPSVLYVVLDDVGFSALESYGGAIETPNIKRIADNGLMYTNFHTTALCSPTRSCLLTGRNHTTNGMACIAEAASGFPNANGHIPLECAMAPEVLGERGWSTFMVGKWHLCAEDEENLASRRQGWPSGRGFDRWYGFLGAETNQWYPDLVYDNHPVDPPKTPEEGYHFSADITDKAISFIRDMKAVAPDKPFFLYYAFGAGHAPHQVPKEWADKYKGKLDMGYEAYREQVFKNQKKLGIIPDSAELSPINPYGDLKGPKGQAWPEGDSVLPWASLKDGEKKLFSRMAEVYAGFVSHADHQLGRMLDYLQESGQLDNTLIVLVSDNGASGEGGPTGSVNENKFFNSIPDSLEDNMKYLDVLGSPLTYNHYPTGWAWAFNTPFKLWKRYASYQGGTADPMIVSWPKQIKKAGIRRQYTHAIDIVPTIYDCLGVEMPDVYRGATQIPLEGESFKASLHDEKAKGKQTQFYSMLGTRGIYHDGWKAASVTPAMPDAWAEFATQRWELFNTETDPSECHDLAGQHPGKLQELVALWWSEAGKYNALPLESRTSVEILTTERPQLSKPRDSTSTTRAAKRCPRPSRSTSATAPTRSQPTSRSTQRRPGVCCSRTGAASAATPSMSRTASSSTTTTTSARWTSTSSRPSRSRPVTAGSRPPSRSRAPGCRPKAPSACTSTRRRSARARSRPSPASSPSPAKGSTSAWTGASRSPATTPATRHGRSPAERSTRSSSTFPVTRGSTAKRKSRPRSHATDNPQWGDRGQRPRPPEEPRSDHERQRAASQLE